MKRLLGAIAASSLCLLGVIPAGAQGVSTPVVTQENVRHIATVPPGTGGHVVVEGNRLYMGNFGTGLSAYDISNPRNPSRIGQYLPGPSNTDGADQGVRTDAPPDAAFWDGRHIVSLGGTNRFANRIQTEFIDFTDPANPQLLWRLKDAPDRESHNGDIVDARKLWLPSGGSGTSGLRIYDMKPMLQTPPAAPVRLFMENPHTLWQNSPYREFYGKSVGGAFNHTHDIEIYTDREIELPAWEWTDQDGDGDKDPTRGLRDIALLAAASGDRGGAVYVIDITDPKAPVVMSKWQNSTGSAHNAISYLHEAQFLHGDPNTIFVADEDMTSGCDEGRVYTFSISDNLVDVAKLGEWTVGVGQQDTSGTCMGAHVFSSHNQHVFMGAYTAGLQVIDMRNPAQPVRAGRYIAEGMNSWGALYHNGLVYTGDLGARGLDVFEFIQEPAAKGIVKVNNPSVTNVASPGGVTEVLGECDPASPANGIDGLIVPIPAEKRDGTHFLRSVGGAGNNVPYDLNVYWYDANCAFMGGLSHNSTNPDEYGTIPEGAAVGVIDLVTGPPMWVYAQIDPVGLGTPSSSGTGGGGR